MGLLDRLERILGGGDAHFDRCVVHIGHAKTGTSAIQRTLHANRDALEERGVHYPAGAANHKFIVNAFHQDPMSFDYNSTSGLTEEEVSTRIETELEEFEAGASRSDAEMLIISSEHLNFLDLPAVEELSGYLQRWARRCTVVCYLRHPVSHAASGAQEKVKNGAARLSEVLAAPPFFKFAIHLPKWVNAFGKEHLVLREYRKERLVGRDVVHDFLDVVGLGDLDLEPKRTNEALSLPATLIADQRARFAPKGTPGRRPAHYLRRITGPPFALPADALARVEEAAEPHLDYLFEEFGIELAAPDPSPPADAAFTEETIASLAEVLDELARANHDLKSQVGSET